MSRKPSRSSGTERMSMSRTAKIAAAGLAAGAIAAAAIVFEMRKTDPPPVAQPPAAEADAHPLAGELARCRALGLDAADNAACRAAWRTQRERFFGADEEPR